MKTIPLSQGQFAIVDDEDFEELNQFRWYAGWARNTHSFYAKRKLRWRNGKQVMELMHRRILGLERGDKRHGDHLNHTTLDNRRSNLRIVTNQENQHNRRGKGFSWNKQNKKYKARITVNGIERYLGLFDTPAEARAAYLEAKAVIHPTAPTMV